MYEGLFLSNLVVYELTVALLTFPRELLWRSFHFIGKQFCIDVKLQLLNILLG